MKLLLGAEKMLVGLTASLLAGVCAAVSYLFNKIVTSPYMDEVFHVPQAQLYCAKNFSHWDPMITTPPGLYFSSFLWMHTLSHYFDLDLCTLTFLRAQNAAFIVLLFLIIHSLLKSIHGDNHRNDSFWILLSAVNLTTFPLLFFFSFLYYTDVGATLFVLVGYLQANRDRHLTAATSLLVALWFRQTSVVWLVFVMGTVAIRTAESAPEVRKCGDQYWNTRYPQAVFQYLITHVMPLLLLLLPYLAVLALFLAFVWFNGSVALGDKTHHMVTFHMPQLFYFLVFVLVLSPSSVVDFGMVRGFFTSSLSNWKRVVCIFAVLVVAMGVAVHLFTYAHSYLLADNRHYPFYLWKNVFRKYSAAKFVLVPVYASSALFLFHTLSMSHHSPLWLACFGVCCFTSLVPQKLLEFRYFTLPFLLYRIHLKKDFASTNTRLALSLEVVFYVAINAVTMWTFLYRPFKWPESDNWQRFMW